MQNGPEKHWDERRKLYLHWEKWGNDIISPNRCTVTTESGVVRVIVKHWTQSMVKVSNGPLFIGREWYVVEGEPHEYDSFDSALKAAFLESAHA